MPVRGAQADRVWLMLRFIAVLWAAAVLGSMPELAIAQGNLRGPLGGARTVNYQLQIEAPEELVEPLRERTLLGRWREDPGFGIEQLPLFLERGREEAVAVAQAAGFFSASARVLTEPAEQAGAPPVVRIVVDAGARTTVAAFSLSLHGAAAGQPIEKQLAQAWPLPEGSFLRSADWEQGKRALLEQLQSAGYLRARIEQSRARVDPELTAAQLSLVVDSGPRIGFGPLVLKGLRRYPRSLVDDLRPFSEGAPYSLDLLLAFQQRLRVAGQFSAVTVLPDLAALEADAELMQVPLLVDLSERSQQRITTGLGYSTDQGARGLLGYDHRNLFGRGWLLESGLQLEQVRGRAFLNLRSPQESGGHYWQGGLRSERLDTLGEYTRTHTAYAGRGKRTEAIDTFLSLQYQAEFSRVDAGEGEQITGNRAALTLGWAWSQRLLDSRVDPRQGYTFSTQVSAASRGVLSDRSFVRLYARGMRFWPIDGEGALPRGTLIGLAEGGLVISGTRDDIPSQNLFRAGGAQSVRGYRYLSLGLKEGDAVVGGRVMALGSLEYQVPVSGNWWAASFVDAGNVVDAVEQWRPAVGYGVGLRWRSPIGPVNLDVAYGQRDRAVRGHFSVGYSF
jgi:translocation and assembly module TamA